MGFVNRIIFLLVSKSRWWSWAVLSGEGEDGGGVGRVEGERRGDGCEVMDVRGLRMRRSRSKEGGVRDGGMWVYVEKERESGRQMDKTDVDN